MEVKEARIATFPSELEARMMEEALRRQGIISVIVPLAPAHVGLLTPVYRPVEMRVRAEDAERAREIIAALNAEMAPPPQHRRRRRR